MTTARQPETFRGRLWRWGLNLRYLGYRGTGAWVTYISPDWHETEVKIPLNIWTRNYVGTIFGGSMYGAVDPIYMIMLIYNLGSGYIVWDKAANIQFKKPGKSTLLARFTLTDDELTTIKTLLETEKSVDRIYTVDLTADDGTVCATIEKTLYIRRKS